MTTNQAPAVRKQPATIRGFLEGPAFKAEVAKLLPKILTPDRFIRVGLTAIQKTPKLAQCDQASFFNAMLQLAQYGLEPDGRRAHLIPYGNSCTLIIDYKGIVELVMRSGLVSNLHADVVCEHDVFEVDRGEVKRHVVNYRQPRGPVYAVYAICRFKDGTEKADVMSVDEIEAIRKRSRAGQAGPWVTDWNEMAKKTVFRRLSKWLTLSPELRDAIEVDDDAIDVQSQVVATQSAESLVEVVGQIESGPAHAIDGGDVKGQDTEAAPDTSGETPEAAANEKPTTQPSGVISPQIQLHDLVTGSGYTFGDFQKWGCESGAVADADSYAGFRHVPTADCNRLLRAKSGLLSGLKMTKGATA